MGMAWWKPQTFTNTGRKQKLERAASDNQTKLRIDFAREIRTPLGLSLPQLVVTPSSQPNQIIWLVQELG